MKNWTKAVSGALQAALILAALTMLAGSPVPRGTALAIYLRQAAIWFPAILGQGLFRMMKVYNLSVGAQITLAAAVAWQCRSLGAPGWVVYPAILAASALFGVLYSAIRPIVNSALVSFGVQYVLSGPIVVLFRSRTERRPVFWADGNPCLFYGLAAATGIVGWLYLNRTSWGRAIPLAIQAEKRGDLSSMPVSLVCCVACALACVLIGISGIFLAWYTGCAADYDSLDYTWRSYMALAISSCITPTRGRLTRKAAVGSVLYVLFNAVCQHLGVNRNAMYWVGGFVILCACVLESFINRNNFCTFRQKSKDYPT